MSACSGLPSEISSLVTELLGEPLQLEDATSGGLRIYRLILAIGTALIVAFGVLYQQLSWAVTDPIGIRAGMAALALGLIGASYRSTWARRQLGRLYRGYIYLTVLWVAGLLVVNQFAWTYAIGVVFLHAAAGLAFGVGLRRPGPLRWLLAVSTVLPLMGAGLVADPITPPLVLGLSLAGLSVLIYPTVNHRIQTERQLRESRQRAERLRREFETIFETVPDATFLVEVRREKGDLRFAFLRLNAAHEDLTGMETDRIRGRTPREVLGEETGAEVEARYRRCVEAGTPIDYKKELSTPAGTKWWHTKLAPVLEDGEAILIVGMARDMTKQRQRESRLREQERILEQIRQNVTDVIWMSTPGKEAMDFISQSYEEVWGRPTGELLEQPTSFLEGIHPQDRDRVASALQVQQDRPEEYKETYRVIRPDGAVRWVRDRASGVYDEEGNLVRVIGIVTDITGRKRRDGQLRLLDRLIQHDLRGDVTTAQGWAEMVASGSNARKAASRIQAATRHMIEILDATDALQRALRSGQRMEQRAVELRPYIERAVQTSERRFPEARITVEYSSEQACVQANELLGSVFENLIANGIRHNDQEIPRVEVQVQQRDDRACVTVADNGPGVPPDKRERIFGKEAHGLDSPGMGLGLYLVETLIRQYGGRVAVTDHEPRGARFVVDLPKAETESE